MPREHNNYPAASREYVAAHFLHMEEEMRAFFREEAKKEAEAKKTA